MGASPAAAPSLWEAMGAGSLDIKERNAFGIEETQNKTKKQQWIQFLTFYG